MLTPISQVSLMQKNAIPNSMMEEEETFSLSEVPREVWREIGKRNQSRLDVSRFRSVCRAWRSSLPPPSRFPLQIPAPPGPPGPSVKHDVASYFISEVTFYAADQPPMIVAFEEEYRDSTFSSSAFLHKTQVHHTKLALPPISKLSPTLSFLCNAYHVHNAFPRSKKKRDAGKSDFYCNFDVLKIVIVSSDASTSNPSYARLCDLKVVAHLYDRKLAVLSLAGGAMNNDWVTAGSSTFEDIVNYKGQLYAVDKSGAAFVMDYNSLHMTQVAPALPNFTVFNPSIIAAFGNRKVLHLAVVGHDLYMFCHEPETVPYPNLYKLSSRLEQWVEARQDLPNQVFVKDVKCNFPVARDLIRFHTHNNRLLQVPRFCSWPDFVFVRIAVGSNNTYDPPCRPRYCDMPQLPYLYRKLRRKLCIKEQ